LCRVAICRQPFENIVGRITSSMSKEANEPPSYDEVAKLPYQDDRSGGQRLIDQLTGVRAEHTRRIVDEKICSVIQERAKHGLSKTTIVLIPSNLHFSKTSNAIDIVDFHGHENEVEQVQLDGNLNRLEFWRQPDVIKELQYVLEDRLSASPVLRELVQKTDQARENATVETVPQRKRSLFDRKNSTQASKDDVSKSETAAGQSQTPSNIIDVRVELEEICMRTISDFGLYETVTQPVVVVKVNINS